MSPDESPLLLAQSRLPRRIPKFAKYLGAATILSLYVWFVCFEYPLRLDLFALAAGLYVLVPLGAICAVLLPLAFAMGRSLRLPWMLLGGVFCLAAFAGFTVLLSVFIQQRAVVRAKAYPNRIAPLLEAYHYAHGDYPKSLDQLPSAPSLPSLLRDTGSYQSDGPTYHLRFSQPGGFGDVWVYDSETRTWHLRT